MEKHWLKNYDNGVLHSLLPHPERTLLDVVHDAALQRPDRAALEFQGATISYSALDRLSDVFAAALAGHRVKKGDRVALLLPNCPPAQVRQCPPAAGPDQPARPGPDPLPGPFPGAGRHAGLSVHARPRGGYAMSEYEDRQESAWGHDPRVAIVRATYRTAEAHIEEALRLLDYCPRNHKLVLKPNVVTAPRWLPLGGVSRSAITDLRFLEALLRVFAGYDIVIAEGGLATYDTGETLEKTGVKALAHRYGAQVVDLDHAERVEVPWKYGTLRMPALLQTHEYINVPKLKTHMLAGMSVGCKNQKGLLSPADKIRFHHQFDLHDAIRALADAVRPALTIVDGIVGLHGPGPTIGRPYPAHLVVAGRDIQAVDVACCDLVSMSLERVAHLSRVPYRPVGCAVEDVRVRFHAPSETVIANAHFHGADGTCSRCLQSAHDGLAAFWRSPLHLLRGTWSCILHRTDVLVGRGHQGLPPEYGRLICYGDCTRKLAQEHGIRWVPGCPPSVPAHLSIY
jgi:uncharacterized protein (DUF362 family)